MLSSSRYIPLVNKLTVRNCYLNLRKFPSLKKKKKAFLERCSGPVSACFLRIRPRIAEGLDIQRGKYRYLWIESQI